MRPNRRIVFLAAPIVALLLSVSAGAWTLDLVETVGVSSSTVRVADVVAAPVPEAAGQVVVAAGGRPGASVEVTQRAVLRRLVMAGLADGVVLAGAERCHIDFAGESIAAGELNESIRAALAPHLPPVDPEAPPSWLGLTVPEVEMHAAGEWEVVWARPRVLEPGRNLVTISLREGQRRRRLSVVAVAHVYARTAVPVSTVPRGQQPDPDALQWAWTDLALTDQGVITDPRALEGMMAARDLAPGETVSQRDLKPRPLVERGELVDLVVRRGGVSAVVRAECRQNGLMGETITVRNKLDGRLVVARVAGPGVVTMGR